MEIFNNREIALDIWIVLFLIFLLLKPSTRKALLQSLPNLFRSMFVWKLARIYLVVLTYNLVVVYILYRYGLWDHSQLKNTILWILAAVVISLSDITNDETSNYLKKTIVDIFKFTIILEFLVGFYSFNLVIELLIVPAATLIPLLIAVGKRDEKTKPAVTFLNSILVIGGIILIAYAVYKVIRGFSDFATQPTLTEFLISPVLSLLFLPCVYLLSLLVNMETAFMFIRHSLPNKALVRYAKWKAIMHFSFNKTNLFRWKQLLLVHRPEDRNGIDQTIRLFKEMKKSENAPSAIDPSHGWSPQTAKDFLSLEGLKTKFYQPLYQQEWQASSNSLELESATISSTAHYSVRGNSSTVTRLILKLNVYFPAQVKNPHGRFLELAMLLYKQALQETMPKTLQDNILNGKDSSINIKGKVVTMVKEKWINHKFHGYDLELVIRVPD